MDLIFAPFELVLNQILFQDPKYTDFLGKYNGKIILINSIYINIKKSGFSFSLSESQNSPDLVINFPYSQSIILLIETIKDNIDHNKIDIDGDLGLAQDFFSVFKNYDGFYLNKIAGIFGDIFAYGADCLDKNIRTISKDKHNNLKDIFSSYLEDELQVVATTDEIKDFVSQVDKIRLDCDRLDARVKKLIQN